MNDIKFEKNMLWIVKIVITVFNIPSTWYVFYDLFVHTDRSVGLAYFNTFMAVLAVDMVFLWVIGVLESDKPPLKRLPAAITSVMLAVLVVLIGIIDEGSLLAFAPRLGLLLLVFNDLLAWFTDMYEIYFSREQIEQRIRNKEVIKRRKIKSEAHKRALNRLSKHFEAKSYSDELAHLGVSDEIDMPEHSGEVVLLGAPEKPLPENIFKTDSGGYGWESPHTGERITEKKLGGEYTLRGATLALSRHTNGYNNGK